MKRVLIVTVLLAAAAAAAVTGMGAGGSNEAGVYEVELDNAFGLIEGADVKVAGVRAGKITTMDIDPVTYRAVIGLEINKQGFGDLRSDVFCETRPQSLIGEYFVDCKPGTSDKKLAAGARIPVTQTGSTVPADLINNIMRRPFRERFSILIGELGVALTARGEDLNETIRRANPALRETDKVLAQLAEQRTVIRDLTDDAEDVVVTLAANRKDIGRFIDEAGDTAETSAERYDDLRKQFQTFPTFLAELRPTMKVLGEAVDRQTPALRNLSATAPQLREFLDTLGPFSEASRPAFRSLAEAARAGRPAIEATRPRIRELGAFAKLLPEVVTNLAVTLEHLDDRKFAVEKDTRSPGGQGYTGFEAILNYVFRQSQATNVYDANSYLLKVSLFLDNLCAQYTDAAQAKDPIRKRCRANLGPNQPGIDNPDPTATGGAKAARRSKKARDDKDTGDAPATTDGGGSGPSEDRDPATPAAPGITLTPEVQKLLDDALGKVPPGPAIDRSSLPLIDFLLGS